MDRLRHLLNISRAFEASSSLESNIILGDGFPALRRGGGGGGTGLRLFCGGIAEVLLRAVFLREDEGGGGGGFRGGGGGGTRSVALLLRVDPGDRFW